MSIGKMNNFLDSRFKEFVKGDGSLSPFYEIANLKIEDGELKLINIRESNSYENLKFYLQDFGEYIKDLNNFLKLHGETLDEFGLKIGFHGSNFHHKSHILLKHSDDFTSRQGLPLEYEPHDAKNWPNNFKSVFVGIICQEFGKDILKNIAPNGPESLYLNPTHYSYSKILEEVTHAYEDEVYTSISDTEVYYDEMENLNLCNYVVDDSDEEIEVYYVETTGDIDTIYFDANE